MSQYLKHVYLFPVQDILVLVQLQGSTSSERRTSAPVQGCPAPGTLTRGGKYGGELELFWSRFNSVNKDESPEFVNAVSKLFNNVRKHGIVPKGWKKGRLVLVHKKAPLTDMGNYRPLTVIVAMSGLFSRVLNETSWDREKLPWEISSVFVTIWVLWVLSQF